MGICGCADEEGVGQSVSQSVDVSIRLAEEQTGADRSRRKSGDVEWAGGGLYLLMRLRWHDRMCMCMCMCFLSRRRGLRAVTGRYPDV